MLLLDDDVYLEPDALEFMLATRVQLRAAVVCPRLVLDPGIVQCDAAAIHFCGMLTLLNSGGPAEFARAPFVARGFIGACLLLDQRMLRGLGGFDEDYFFYFEDLELSYRLSALGLVIACDPRAIAVHDRGEGTQGLAFRGAGPYPTRRAYYVLRHRWLSMLLHFQTRTLVLLFPALAAYEIASLAECVRRSWLGPWLRASAWIWLHLPAILRRRRRWQSLRRIPDADILTAGPLPFSSGFIEGDVAARLGRGLDRILNSYWNALQKWHWISPS